MKRQHTFVGWVFVLALVIGATGAMLTLAATTATAAADVVVARAPDAAWLYGLAAAALSTALGALGAGFAVGKVGTAAVGALAEKPELFGRLLILVGLAEGIAIYGLIVSILILNRLAG